MTVVKMDPEITKMRRRIVLAVVRRKPRSTVRSILVDLRELHARGEWPQARWAAAQNTPYIGQIGYILNWLTKEGRLVEMRLAPGWTRCWLTPEAHKAEAEALLPQGAEVPRLLERARQFWRDTGMELAFGVTDDLQRVVRVQTHRGGIDFPVDPQTEEYPWDEAIQDAMDDLACAA